MNGSGAESRRIGKRGENPPRPRHCERSLGISVVKPLSQVDGKGQRVFVAQSWLEATLKSEVRRPA